MSDQLGSRVTDLVIEVQRWTAASNRLFAVGAVDEEAYMETVGLVGQAMNHLRQHCPTVESLATASPQLRRLLDGVAGEQAAAGQVDLDLIVDAARGVRYGEIAARTAPSGTTPGSNAAATSNEKGS